jgi:hypothetical protein
VYIYVCVLVCMPESQVYTNRRTKVFVVVYIYLFTYTYVYIYLNKSDDRIRSRASSAQNWSKEKEGVRLCKHAPPVQSNIHTYIHRRVNTILSLRQCVSVSECDCVMRMHIPATTSSSLLSIRHSKACWNVTSDALSATPHATADTVSSAGILYQKKRRT